MAHGDGAGADIAVRVAVWPLHPLTSKAHNGDHQAVGVALGLEWHGEAPSSGATRRGRRATRVMCARQAGGDQPGGRGRSASDLL
jgi:hypothetical protein